MSQEYTKSVLAEIEYYLRNLEEMEKFNTKPIENIYVQYITEVENLLQDEIVIYRQKVASLEKENKEHSSKMNQLNEELTECENALQHIKTVKNAAAGLTRQIKKNEKEIEELTIYVNQPLRRLFGGCSAERARLEKLKEQVTEKKMQLAQIEKENCEAKASDDCVKALNKQIQKEEERHNNVLAEFGGKGASPTKLLSSMLKNVMKCAIHDRQKFFADHPAMAEWKTVYAKSNMAVLGSDLRLHCPLLLEIMAIHPNMWDFCDMPEIAYKFSVKLNDTFAIACREKYIELCDKQNNLFYEGDWEQLRFERSRSAFSAISCASEQHKLNDEPLQQLIDELCPRSAKDTEKPKAQSTTIVERDPLFFKAVALAVEAQCASTDLLQRRLRLGCAHADRLIDELEKAGVIGPAIGSGLYKVYFDVVQSIFPELVPSSNDTLAPDKNNGISASVVEDLLSEWIEDKESIEKMCEVGMHIRKDFLLSLREMLQNNPDMDLPDIAMTFHAEEIERNVNVAQSFIDFRSLYRLTPEQIAQSNMECVAKKEREQMRENARLEREMYERQAEENRIAEAHAEYERKKVREASEHAQWQLCYKCTSFGKCQGGVLNCAAFRPK